MSSGRGQMNSVQNEINKTYYILGNRPEFLKQIDHEIKLSFKRAKNKGFNYTCRLNGTSDLPFERYLENGKNLMDNNPHVQFIDYTKIRNRFKNKLPKNYSLTFSQSEINKKTQPNY